MNDAARTRLTLISSAKARLVLAFGLIVGLGIVIGSIGWVGFSRTEQALNDLSENSLADMGDAMELARQSAIIASAAPFVASIRVFNKLKVESDRLEQRLQAFRELVDKIQPAPPDGAAPETGSLRDLALRLEVDLGLLFQNTREALDLRSDILELEYAFEEQRQIEAAPEGADVRLFRQLVATVLDARASDSPTDLARLQGDYDDLAARLAAGNASAQLRDFLAGQARIFGLRDRELALAVKAEFLLASINSVSGLLSATVAQELRRTTELAGAQSALTSDQLDQARSRILILTLVSAAIGLAAGWYVVRDLAGNLQAVTAAMTRLALGDRETTVPATERSDEMGSLARAFNIFKDQSFEREALAMDLVEKSRTLEATLTNITDGLSVFDAEGRLSAWNPQFARLNELDTATIGAGTHFRDVIRQLRDAGVMLSTAERGTEDVEALLARRQSEPMRYEQVFPSKRVVELRSHPMEGGFVTIYSDQTERRAFEERLRQAQRMEAVAQLTSGLAHDFNNLLAAISGNLQMLQEELCDRPDMAPRILRALAAADRGAELNQRLLAFARQQVLHPEETDVNALVRGLLDLMDFSIGDRITVATDLQPDLGGAMIDQAQLQNALLNLILNARDAMPKGGRITIRTEARPALAEGSDGKWLCISVIDEGSGMAPDVVAHVFEPFFTTKERGSGSGLGLSMVYGFVTQSGGEVDIDSAPGQGTSVTIRLPVWRRVALMGRADRTVPPGEVARGAGERILIVEDDRLVRETAVDMLSGLGYATATAEGLAEAKARLDRARFDLVLTDWLLSRGETGDSVAAYAETAQPGIGVLYTSGYPREKLQSDRQPPAGIELIAKPYRKEVLAAAIRRALERVRA